MTTCEHHEANLSAVLDGELTTVDLTSTLDHLIDCPSCADFYRRSRDLDCALAEHREAAMEPSAELWDGIAARAPWAAEAEASPRTSSSQTSPDVAEVTPLRRRRSEASAPEVATARRPARMQWAPRLAAVFVLAFGLFMVHLVTRDGGVDSFSRDSSEAVVDARRVAAPGGDEMNEERFVELASEVLRADARYHHEMLEVMRAVTRSEGREATADVRSGDEGFDLAGGTRGEGDRSRDGRVWK